MRRIRTALPPPPHQFVGIPRWERTHRRCCHAPSGQTPQALSNQYFAPRISSKTTPSRPRQ